MKLEAATSSEFSYLHYTGPRWPHENNYRIIFIICQFPLEEVRRCDDTAAALIREHNTILSTGKLLPFCLLRCYEGSSETRDSLVSCDSSSGPAHPQTFWRK